MEYLPESETKIYLTLKRTFGYHSFRPHQKETVKALIQGQDAFVVMPSGGGKSPCYQIPASIMDGTCVVISPLISLMKDQVDNARTNGLKAACFNSSQTSRERSDVLRDLHRNALDLLYISPERLALDHFRDRLKQADIGLFAVDEAHCISEWGHDFRPDYMCLKELKSEFPDTPVAGFTATATPRVQRDIVQRLNLDSPHMVRASFDRPNFFYQVEPKENVLRQIADFVRPREGESGVVYRTTRDDVESTAEHLQEKGISALPYHAGLDKRTRRDHQEEFHYDRVDVIVATVAFGMGIDKPNVRYVVHGDLPKNLESYYQETGRAGRDGDPAHCLLLFSPGDAATIRYFIDQIEKSEERDKCSQKLSQMVR
ncbi:MAG: RecQ family ATP-dependent DNA helicase, partial [Planctomycetota bacterium]